MLGPGDVVRLDPVRNPGYVDLLRDVTASSPRVGWVEEGQVALVIGARLGALLLLGPDGLGWTSVGERWLVRC